MHVAAAVSPLLRDEQRARLLVPVPWAKGLLASELLPAPEMRSP